ncbi:hypothetical protein [Archangium lipolyticum]|uniref:hypothetical protein n=1 Tax=Archangium lipolyticum TaxID=2970465 RepID=UPI00214A8033|nr:hypothetical protein [Archangium lipolyticum]
MPRFVSGKVGELSATRTMPWAQGGVAPCTGIRLDDIPLILQGAVPAAGLALLVNGLFEFVARLVIPRGLRL